MRRYFLSVIVCCLAFTTAVAQPQRHYIFTHYKKSNGLMSNKVFHVAQDAKGYMWIGTDNGLQRFDGYRFTTWRHTDADTLGLPDDQISLVHVDQKGRLWLVSGAELGMFDADRNRFRRVPMKVARTEIDKGIRKFISNSEGKVMVFVAKNLLTYNEQTNEMSADNNFIKAPAGMTVEDIYQDPLTKVYWITGKSGLIAYNHQQKRYAYKGNNPDSVGAIKWYGDTGYVKQPYVDQKGRLWFAQGMPFKGKTNLYCYDPRTNKGTSYTSQIVPLLKSFYEVWGMTEQTNGNLFLYGYNMLLEFDERTGRFVTVRDESLNEYTIKYDYVTKIFRDREENLWACTNQGLFLFNPKMQPFTAISHMRPGDTVKQNTAATSVFYNDRNEIWVGTWGKGVFSYDFSLNPIPNPIITQKPEYANLAVWGMCRRKNGEVWIGSTYGHVVIYQPDKGIVGDFNLGMAEGGMIRQVNEDRAGNVWMGTDMGHVIRCDNGNWRDSTHSFKLVKRMQGRVIRFFERKDGSMWFATDILGLYRIDPRSGAILDHYDDKKGPGKSLFNSTVTDMLEYNDSIVLVASNSINYINTRTKLVGNITTANGLPSNQVINLTKDQAGYIWVSLSNGLCRFKFGSNSFSSYDVRDGVLNDNFEMNSSTFLPDGRLVMGTLHDFLVFNPEEVNRLNNFSTEVSITGFKLMGEPLSVDSLLRSGTVDLGYNENSISIDYSCMRFLQQNKIIYYHRLNGIDKDWVRSDIQQAVYTYLPPGTYTFQTRAVNGNGMATEKLTTLTIKVDRPFWKSWWFYAALALIAMALVYFLDQERIKRLLSMQRMRTQIAGDLHKEIHSTLNNIHLLSELAKMKAGKEAERSKEYINQISDKSKRMIIAMDDILWSIEPENDSMDKMLLRMREYTEALRNHHGSTINFQVEEKVSDIRLDMNVRHQLLLIFKKGLRAAVEIMKGRQTVVNIDLARQKLLLKIQDLTITEEAGAEAADAFDDMRRRAESINASLDVQAEFNRLSVILALPVTSPSTS